MEQRLTIITLGVADVKKSTTFYESKFGWTKSSISNDHITFFQLNGIYLSLYSRESLAEDAKITADGSGFKGITLAYNTRTKEEVDALFDEYKVNGVTIVKEPTMVDWGGYSGYVADLDDNLWEIAFNPFLSIP